MQNEASNNVRPTTAIVANEAEAEAARAAGLSPKIVPVATTPATTEAAKPAKRAAKPAPASANGKAAQKRVAAKANAPAKPTAEARAAAQAAENDARRLARDCASRAVSEFYSGLSKPFKAAADRFADINVNNGKSATTRQAGLALALITYGAGNMLSDGTFTRGAFVVPAKLVNPNAKPGETVRAQPESGCLGNMLGRAADYVSGPKTGREQSAAVYRLRVNVVLDEIKAAFGDKARNAAAKLLAGYPAKRAA